MSRRESNPYFETEREFGCWLYSKDNKEFPSIWRNSNMSKWMRGGSPASQFSKFLVPDLCFAGQKLGSQDPNGRCRRCPTRCGFLECVLCQIRRVGDLAQIVSDKLTLSKHYCV